jgi:hypothetical protein
MDALPPVTTSAWVTRLGRRLVRHGECGKQKSWSSPSGMLTGELTCSTGGCGEGSECPRVEEAGGRHVGGARETEGIVENAGPEQLFERVYTHSVFPHIREVVLKIWLKEKRKTDETFLVEVAAPHNAPTTTANQQATINDQHSNPQSTINNQQSTINESAINDRQSTINNVVA